MRIAVTITAITLLFASACASSRGAASHHPPTLFGVTLGDPEARVHSLLQSRAKFIRADRGQEAWNLDDESYRALIIGYDTEHRVRYVTAAAKPDGKRVRYADVLDVAKAEHAEARGQQFYRATVERWPESRSYRVVTRGGDAVYLDYLTVRRASDAEGEEEED